MAKGPWDTMKVSELKEQCRSCGLKVSGSKEELVERLKIHRRKEQNALRRKEKKEELKRASADVSKTSSKKGRKAESNSSEEQQVSTEAELLASELIEASMMEAKTAIRLFEASMMEVTKPTLDIAEAELSDSSAEASTGLSVELDAAEGSEAKQSDSSEEDCQKPLSEAQSDGGREVAQMEAEKEEDAKMQLSEAEKSSLGGMSPKAKGLPSFLLNRPTPTRSLARAEARLEEEAVKLSETSEAVVSDEAMKPAETPEAVVSEAKGCEEEEKSEQPAQSAKLDQPEASNEQSGESEAEESEESGESGGSSSAGGHEEADEKMTEDATAEESAQEGQQASDDESSSASSEEEVVDYGETFEDERKDEKDAAENAAECSKQDVGEKTEARVKATLKPRPDAFKLIKTKAEEPDSPRSVSGDEIEEQALPEQAGNSPALPKVKEEVQEEKPNYPFEDRIFRPAFLENTYARLVAKENNSKSIILTPRRRELSPPRWEPRTNSRTPRRGWSSDWASNDDSKASWGQSPKAANGPPNFLFDRPTPIRALASEVRSLSESFASTADVPSRSEVAAQEDGAGNVSSPFDAIEATAPQPEAAEKPSAAAPASASEVATAAKPTQELPLEARTPLRLPEAALASPSPRASATASPLAGGQSPVARGGANLHLSFGNASSPTGSEAQTKIQALADSRQKVLAQLTSQMQLCLRKLSTPGLDDSAAEKYQEFANSIKKQLEKLSDLNKTAPSPAAGQKRGAWTPTTPSHRRGGC
eukprot:TRINITY_DN12616_c0_g1_i1.p1 TRINITY_DN12616_c0_g1~~TRINITY_DN12616_c0_g1_i1.p1  ORF type:complete len:764 (+),score=230.59 TRINITY_DN12616_c0_g1_i1:140-2431(+)